MPGKYYPPQFRKDGFNCPQCDVYARQYWMSLYGVYIGSKRTEDLPDGFTALCESCRNFSIWISGKMIYPISSIAPLPADDMPKDIVQDYTEARNIANSSSRSACALLRLALQKLMIHLGEKSGSLNDDIGNLVKKGLPQKIQKALDTVRVIGNNAVHPGELDLKDDNSTAVALFELVNMIVDVMITQPKHVDDIFDKIPDGAKEAIRKRDEK